MDTPTPAPVLRRRVCYLSGFDPQGPAHYHQLYATQAALQSGVNGWPITVGPRRKAGPQIARVDAAHAVSQILDHALLLMRRLPAGCLL